MKSLVLGAGEVGQALYKVLKEQYCCCLGGKITKKFGIFEIIHICFPYFKGFEKEVRRYQKLFNPKYTVIHSTVPIGTARRCRAYHSPIRGMHPVLAKHLKIFPKYLAPPNRRLKRYFEKAGIPIILVKRPETTEFLKIWDTTQYGINILLEKSAFQFCQKHKLDFDVVYIHANKSYNEIYNKLGMGHVQRPVLKNMPGKIGGHCIIENCGLLDSPITKFLKAQNKKL